MILNFMVIKKRIMIVFVLIIFINMIVMIMIDNFKFYDDN